MFSVCHTDGVAFAVDVAAGDERPAFGAVKGGAVFARLDAKNFRDVEILAVAWGISAV